MCALAAVLEGVVGKSSMRERGWRNPPGTPQVQGLWGRRDSVATREEVMEGASSGNCSEGRRDEENEGERLNEGRKARISP